MNRLNQDTSLEKIQPRVESPAVISVPAYDQEYSETHPLQEYWQIVQKRRWTILSILLVVFVTVAIGTLKQRPVYRAKVVLQIDRENPNILSFKDFAGLEGSDEELYLETSYKTLQSRTLARGVIQKLQLDQRDEFKEESSTFSLPWSSSPKVPSSVAGDQTVLDPKLQRVMQRFLDQLTVTPVRRSRLVEISFDSNDPVLAARVTNTLASTYIEDNLKFKWEATLKASDLISEQLVGLKAKLEKSEEELQRYAKENAILQVDEKQNIASQKLKQLQEEYVKGEAELFQKQSVYDQVKGGDLSSVPGMMDNKIYQDLSSRLSDLRREYSELSTTFTPEYPKLKRLKSQIDETEASLQKERNMLARKITDDYRAAEARVKLLRVAVTGQGKEFNDIAEKSIQYNILKREVDTNRQIYEGLLQRLKEAGVSAGMKANNIRVVDQAEVPPKPAKPRVVLNLALGLILGMGLGVGMAFFQEYLDNTLKSPDDVQRFVRLPALGMIPAAHSGKNGKGYGYGYGYGYRHGSKKAAATALIPKEVAAQLSPELVGPNGDWALLEAYRSLRTSILLSASDRQLRTMVVTSAHPREGKTTTTVNLAITLAQLGSRVLLIDADMRKPRVAELLKVPASPGGAGLSTCLTGQFTLDQSVVATAVPNVFLVPCGPIPPNPPELLSSKAMRQLLSDAREKFDFVMLDSPPLLMVSDGRILASQADGVILVAHGAQTPRVAVNQAKMQLLQANAHVVGVALNNMDFSRGGYGKYYYRGYYSSYGQEEAQNGRTDPPS